MGQKIQGEEDEPRGEHGCRHRRKADVVASQPAALPANADVSWQYGCTFRHLPQNGQLIGANDLWIAATGLAYRMPVVTKNVGDYRRVPGLEVLGY